MTELVARPRDERREAARARAECFGWGAAVDAFLQAHDAVRVRADVPLQGAVDVPLRGTVAVPVRGTADVPTRVTGRDAV